jgi:3-oxoacyl-[acyl-carrier protein] reductase
MAQYDGMVALVTGGSRGIGAAVSRALAARGATVALTYKSGKEKADALVKEISGQGGKIAAFAADVADETAIKKAADQVADKFGKIDFLINNAGVLGLREIEAIDYAFYDNQFKINVWGTIAATQAALKHFPASGGRIVNISSLRVYAPVAKSSIYSASKAAVTTLTQSFAAELGPRHITVNAIAPGITATDMTAAMPDERRKMIAEGTPLRRLAGPDDVAGAVLMLLSDDAKWITGRTILADGGFIGAA